MNSIAKTADKMKFVRLIALEDGRVAGFGGDSMGRMLTYDPTRDAWTTALPSANARTGMLTAPTLARLPDPLPRLTESVLGYLEVISRDTPVIYAAIEGDEQAACGWCDGQLELGPLRSDGVPRPRTLFRRREPGAVDAALCWLGAPRSETLRLADQPLP